MLNSIQEIEVSLQKNENPPSVEKLVNFKFCIEREYNSLNDLLKNLESKNWIDIVNHDIEIYAKVAQYKNTIKTTGYQFLEGQRKLLDDIDETLIKKCEHNWIEDTIDEPLERSKNICYCSKCYIYTKK